MLTKTQLQMLLSQLQGFQDPNVQLEQYTTPPAIAATVVHLADLQEEVYDRHILDLGTGTGVLAIAAALRGARSVVGIEQDAKALDIAQTNLEFAQTKFRQEFAVEWQQQDVSTFETTGFSTCIMNPPFGLQTEDVNLTFLETATRCAQVTYALLHASQDKIQQTRTFYEEWAAQKELTVTWLQAFPYTIPKTHEFHTETQHKAEMELYRFVQNTA